MVRDFKKLDVWENSYSFSLDIYKITKSFPTDEKFGLTQQIRRAASSISANIAEGCGRGSKKDFIRFLFNAYGSTKECENFLMLAKDLEYVSEGVYSDLSGKVNSISRMLNKFIETLNSDIIREEDQVAQGPKPIAHSNP